MGLWLLMTHGTLYGECKYSTGILFVIPISIYYFISSFFHKVNQRTLYSVETNVLGLLLVPPLDLYCILLKSGQIVEFLWLVHGIPQDRVSGRVDIRLVLALPARTRSNVQDVCARECVRCATVQVRSCLTRSNQVGLDFGHIVLEIVA